MGVSKAALEAQEEAINMITKYICGEGEDKGYFSLGGYAGSGKSEIISVMTNGFMKEHKLEPTLLAPTNRACRVLSNRCGKEVKTLHSTLYKPVRNQHKGEVGIIIGIQCNPGAPGNKVYDPLNGKPYVIQHKYMWDSHKSNYSNEADFKVDSLRKAMNYMKNHKLQDTAKILIDADYQKLDWELKTDEEIFEAIGGGPIIVDEISMVSDEMQLYLQSLPNKVVFVGDPAQLGPVYPDDDDSTERQHLSDHPDIVLTEVVRTDDATGITSFATDLRNNTRPLKSEYGGGVSICKAGRIPFRDKAGSFFPKASYLSIVGDVAKNMCLTNTQFLVCRTLGVVEINDIVKAALGHTAGVIVPNDRIIVMTKDPDAGLNRNDLLKVIEVRHQSEPRKIKTDAYENFKIRVREASILAETETGRRVSIDITMTGAPNLINAEFSYAMTTHRSQGSGFENTVWVNDCTMRQAKSLPKLCYTGATRAVEKLRFYG